MLLYNIFLFIILLTFTILIRIDYFKNRKRRFFGSIIHAFFYKNLYDDYDDIIEKANEISK